MDQSADVSAPKQIPRGNLVLSLGAANFKGGFSETDKRELNHVNKHWKSTRRCRSFSSTFGLVLVSYRVPAWFLAPHSFPSLMRTQSAAALEGEFLSSR